MRGWIGVVAACVLAACGSGSKAPEHGPSEQAPADLLASSPAADWRTLDPESTLYLELPKGRVVIALAPAFAPTISGNVKALAREKYFDGAAILRAQDNYVVQWGRPEEDPRPFYTAQAKLGAEYARAIAEDIDFTAAPDSDVYAAQSGFSQSFPVGRDPEAGLTWLAHCYGMVGAGRDVADDSGAGQELYVVIGNAPRHLDRNVTLIGRVVQGMELLSTMPRGTGELGFYETAAERTPITSMRVAADVPESERTNLEVLRSDSATFATYLASRRTRTEEWFKYAAGHIDVCNAPLPVREKK